MLLLKITSYGLTSMYGLYFGFSKYQLYIIITIVMANYQDAYKSLFITDARTAGTRTINEPTLLERRNQIKGISSRD